MNAASTDAAAAADHPGAGLGARIVLVVSLACLAALVGLCAKFTYQPPVQLFLGAGAFLTFVPAVVAWRRLDHREAIRHGTALMFGVAILLNVLAVTGPPATSDDDWRYQWDGRVQMHGIDPYRYSARAHQLNALRDTTIFPTARPCEYYRFAEDGRPEQDRAGCTRMNRPQANTIYPPFAELFFATEYVMTAGGHGNEFSMQVAAGLGVILIGWLLWRRARARGEPTWWVALWLWCPTVVLEATQNAHIDWLGALLVVVAVTVVPSERVVLRGLLLGAATGVKLYPALVGPSFLRRRPVALLLSAAGLFAVSYVPHVLAVGVRVIGFLPTYLEQENYSSGSRFLLVSLVFRGSFAVIAALCIIAAATLWAVLRGDPEHPERTAVVVVGTALLVATPNQPWYALLLVALAVLARRPEWLLLGPVMAVYYLSLGHVGDPSAVGRWGFVACLILVVGCTLWRARHARGDRAPMRRVELSQQ